MGVSKNRGTPKWMVKIMENPIEMDDLGSHPYFRKHPHLHGMMTCHSFWMMSQKRPMVEEKHGII